MKVGLLLIAGLAASIICTAGGCGAANSLLGPKQDTNQWLQQNQARVFQDMDVREPKIEPFTHFAAGQLLEGKNRIHQAIAQYRKALDLNSKFIGARNRLAICLDKVGQHTEAERALRRAIKVKPKLAYLRNNLAFSLMAQKRWSDSERELRTALELKPDYQRARVNLGIVMSKLARRDEAFQQFQMVLGDARAHYNMGLLDKAGGRYAQAAESFRNAIALEPNLQAAKIQLEKLRTMARVAPRKFERQTAHATPIRSVVATRMTRPQPTPVHTIRVAAAQEQVQEHEIVSAKPPITPPARESREQNNTVVETVVAAQAEPDIPDMSIGRPEEPIVADEMEDNEADFSWEVADVSATAPSPVNDRPAPEAKVERPAPKAPPEAPKVATAPPVPVQPQLANPVPNAPAAETPLPTYSEIEAGSLPFFTYEEPCEVRKAGRSAPQPERPDTPCAEDELIVQFMLGDSGFDSAPILATDGRNLASVLKLLQENLAKKWRLRPQPTEDSTLVPTTPAPAAEIELSATRVP